MKNLMLVFSYIFLLSVTAEAMPIFAKKYNMACTACHTKPPALNTMGRKFIRDGFKLSTVEKSTFDLLFDSNISNRKIPIDVLHLLVKNKDMDHLGRKTKVHLGGSITESLSFLGFISSGWYRDLDNDKKKFFEDRTSMYYFQYGLEESKHLFRVGSFYPLAQFGEVRRSQRFAPFIERERKYKKPAAHVSTGKIKGFEYSYLSDTNLLFMVNGGKEVFSGKREYNAGINYYINNNFSVGALYTRLNGENRFIFPLGVEYNDFSIYSSLFYRNSDKLNNGDRFVGAENTFIYSFADMQQARVMFNTDNMKNHAYSIEYNKIFEPVLGGFVFQFTASFARVEKNEKGKESSDNIFQVVAVIAF